MTTTTKNRRCRPGVSSIALLRYLPRRVRRHAEPEADGSWRTGGGTALAGGAALGVPAGGGPLEVDLARGIGPVLARAPEPRAQLADAPLEPEPPDPLGGGSGGAAR